MRKLRELYDRIYVGLDTLYLAWTSGWDARRRARTLPPKENLDRDYREKVKPYWRQFNAPMPKKFWYRSYGPASEPVDPRYIPYDIWVRRIVPHYNTLLFATALQDKCLHNLFVPDIQRPVTVVKSIGGVFCDDELSLLTREEALARCRRPGRFIIKPSVGSGGGANIRFFDGGALSDDELIELLRQYGKNFIVQEKLSQHEVLAAFNPRSVNTLRIYTFLFRNEVHILSVILRVGGGSNEVDNVSQGGYQCTVLEGGRLEPTAITKRGKGWVHVDQTASGVRFADVTIPNYERILDTVRAAAAKMLHFRILGWDIAVSPEGEPVLVEYNVIPDQSQATCGPAFGGLTDEVLEEVFGRR